MPKKGTLANLANRLRRVVLFLVAAQLIYIILLRWVNPPITITQLSSWLQGEGLSRDYVSYDAISPNAALAVIAAEDQLFPQHNGFDVKSIKEAIDANQNKKRKRLRGASTISQQVAKNVFLWQGRSWVRKGIEVYFTFMIEAIWGKKRILEVYLNVAEMGKGIYGIEAAARHYYKKPAKALTRSEAASIAACLPNPARYSVNPPSPYVVQRRLWILGQMHNLEGDDDIDGLIHPKRARRE